MTKKVSDEFLGFLEKKWGNRGCPMCGKGPWTVQENIFQLSEFHEGNLVVGGPLIPIVPVSCLNCGNTILVNAIIAGAVKPDGQQPEPKA